MSPPLIVILVFALGGCATLSKEDAQVVDVRVFNLEGRQVEASCRMVNGAQTMVGNSPLFRVPVSRSGSDLVIECSRPGMPPARAVAVSRSSHAIALVVQPFATTMIDHFTGRLYDYPVRMDLVLGRELVFDRRSDDDLPVRSRPVPISHVAGEPGLDVK